MIRKRKDNIKQVFDESLSQSEDIELWLRFSLKTHLKFEGINKTLSIYRVNAYGLSANIANQYQHWQSVEEPHTQSHPGFLSVITA